MAIRDLKPTGCEPHTAVPPAEEDRHGDDILIRSCGFRIESRPSVGPTVWRRGDKTYSHDVALGIAVRESKRKSKLKGGV